MNKFLGALEDLKDLGLILFGFVAFITPMIVVTVEGIRCANFGHL